MQQSITLRVILIVSVIIILILPLYMIQSLITERQQYRNEAVSEISKGWAGYQTIGGPVLTINEKIEKQNKSGNKYFTENSHHYLPDILNYSVEVIPEKRKRGIYEALQYTAKIKIDGLFKIDDIDVQKENQGRSFISLNISDLKGIVNNPKLYVDDSLYALLPGLVNNDIYQNGLHTALAINEIGKKMSFNIDIELKGIEDLNFLPVGKTTNVNLKSIWNNPSFAGPFLPSKRELTKEGFNAMWSVNSFNRNFPQNWMNKEHNIQSSKFGVKFLLPVDEYQKTMRTSKYGLMIIVLTFLSFFMMEVLGKKTIHPVQYLLVGLALVIFYSLLLAISEYLAFESSYLISSMLVIGLISIYVKSAYKSIRSAIIISGLLTVFYGFMYTIIQLQDYSLLIGNIALFFLLALVMFLTRKINWFEALKPKTN